MKKIYTNPFITVEKFDAENIVTVSGEIGTAVEDVTSGLNGYSVKTIDAQTIGIDFTF